MARHSPTSHISRWIFRMATDPFRPRDAVIIKQKPEGGMSLSVPLNNRATGQPDDDFGGLPTFFP
jgi:hypothetical protein